MESQVKVNPAFIYMYVFTVNYTPSKCCRVKVFSTRLGNTKVKDEYKMTHSTNMLNSP